MEIVEFGPEIETEECEDCFGTGKVQVAIEWDDDGCYGTGWTAV